MHPGIERERVGTFDTRDNFPEKSCKSPNRHSSQRSQDPCQNKSARVTTDWNTPRYFVSASPVVVTRVRCTALRVPVCRRNVARRSRSRSSNSRSTANGPSQNFISQRLITRSSRSISRSICAPSPSPPRLRHAQTPQTTPDMPSARFRLSVC